MIIQIMQLSSIPLRSNSYVFGPIEGASDNDVPPAKRRAAAAGCVNQYVAVYVAQCVEKR